MIDRPVLDTSELIDFQRDHADGRRFVSALLDKDAVTVHPVVVAEMLAGVLNRADLVRTKEFLARFKRLTVKSVDFETCIFFLAEVHLTYGTGWPDCLIAATCMRLGLPLVTMNDKHFRATCGPRLVRPY